MNLDIGKALNLTDFVRLTDELAEVLKSSIGIDGKAVLISQKSPRQITVTKVTFCILAPLEDRTRSKSYETFTSKT